MTSDAERQRRHRQRMYANGWHYVNGRLIKTPRKRPQPPHPTQGAPMTTDDDQLAKLAAIDDLDTNVEPCADCGGTGINPEHKQLDLDCEWCLGTGVIRTT